MDREEFTRRALDMEYSLYRVAKTLLRSDHDCADAVQESLVKGLQAARGLRQSEYFKTWMTRILVNTCKDMLKKQARRPAAEISEALPAKDDTEQRELYEALQTIPEELRLPLVLHYMEGLTVREVSQVLHVPEGTVKRRLWLGRKEMHALLREDEEVG